MTVGIETRRRGMLYVTVGLWKQMESRPETCQEWHDALLLPDTYEVESIARQSSLNSGDRFALSVLSDAIPESDSHITQVELTPFYNQTLDEQTGTYTPHLVRIEIRQWNGETWETVAS